jgi:hypothetical protein
MDEISQHLTNKDSQTTSARQNRSLWILNASEYKKTCAV